jgi:hypothetical protein
MYALYEQRLGLDSNNCVFLAASSTTGQEAVYAVWPAGYTAFISAGELTLYDAVGRAIAHEGDRIRAGGGAASVRPSASKCLPDSKNVVLIQSEVEKLPR